MKRKRPTRESAAAKHKQALEGQRNAWAGLIHATSTFFLALNRKEPNKSECQHHQQTKGV